MNRYKDILTTKKDHLEEEKNISVDERVDNLIKLKTIRKKHENILNIQNYRTIVSYKYKFFFHTSLFQKLRIRH